jgi:hypothetical protein
MAGLFLALGAVALFASQASAADKGKFKAALGAKPGSVGYQVGGSEPPGDPVNLTIDDGTQEDCIGLTAGGQFLWMNRFTPTEFPVGLTQIQIIFGAIAAPCNVPIGSTYDLATYTDNNSNPADGATNVSSHPGQTVTATDVFLVTTFPQADFPSGPDIEVGAVNRTGMDGAGQFPAAIDQTATQVRSWVGFGGVPPTPPPVPFGTFDIIDNFGLPGNWMMRASGTVTPVELQDFSIQ